MLTLSVLLNRSVPEARCLAGETGGTLRVETAIIVPDGDLAHWSDTDVAELRQVVVILPVPAVPRHDRIQAAVRRAGAGHAAAVVLAEGSAEPGSLDLEAVAASARPYRTPLLLAPHDPSRVWARMMTVIRNGRDDAVKPMSGELREMHREAAGPDGLKRLLRRLARQVSGTVVLLDRDGAPLHAFPEIPGHVLDQMATEIERVVTGEVRAVAADLGDGVVRIQAIGGDTTGATLVVIRKERFSSAVQDFVADASRLIALRWRVDDLTRRQRRVDDVETRTREVVLQLLMTGNLQAARRVAGALGPSLAERIRVYVLTGPAARRDRSVAYCRQMFGDRAWVVRCPVYIGHVIILAPFTNDAVDETADALRVYAGQTEGLDVGASTPVALRETESGYGQAFHALAVARGSTGHYAEFDSRGDVASLVRPRGHRWARSTLEPLSSYRPPRAQDPAADELIATLRAWLDFGGGAARQLKIHRNTLAARLRHIERLIGHPLDDLETQSRLHLAMRVLDGPAAGDGPGTLEELLDDLEVRRWADRQMTPLSGRDSELFSKTLRVWLERNARIEATASVLGISVPGTRKRLTRIEEVLGRALLSGPSARYELWLALRVQDGFRDGAG
ncbi:helix-turn-helix domain-containing protein [Actinomadura sp. DC4]|uniref:helix-turn-helix domain-containing protein n=1 Tax=Actinomadura sp. DC4 TaxID=3055069 RepID=UPI0025B1C648|nr:helix-turn-helix domain-containing protein [Actinomadura sp. DC4]MDN3352183.1 helix-turn-helix domain-containing protein [Actinomadura sp. DC4]